MDTLTAVFILAVGSGVLLRLWLYRRQAAHVSAHRNGVPVPFTARVSLPDHQKAADYTLAKLRLATLELALGSAVLLIWTLGGGLELLLGSWRASSLPPLLAGTAAVLSVFLVQGLVEMPLAVWRTFGIESRFGFNRTTVGGFAKDTLLAVLLLLSLGTPLISALLWLLHWAGTAWWLYAWALWVAFSLFMAWFYPTVIAPLFNRFTPLNDGELKRRVSALLHRCGFSSKGVFVMDGSRRSSHGNAYFTGFGRSKRIVFFDTLIERLGVAELEAVLAHELGHFKRRHVLQRLLGGAAVSLAGFWVLGAAAAQPWFYEGLGLSGPDDAGALLLFVLVAPVFTQFAAPLAAWLMRRQEFQADDYALDHADGTALIQALVKLYQDNASTLTPDPLYSAFHDSHPPAPVRIAHISARMAPA